jgi:signal transduction histidine kinase
VIARLRALFTRRGMAAEIVDLNDAAREVIALCGSELQRNQIAVQTDFAGALPTVRGDRVQLQQVIINLLLNASESMREVNDRPRWILVQTALHPPGAVRVTLRDTGVGVDPDRLSKLFDAFYTTKPDGMGIGLSVSRSIIERHNGRLWASRNDNGPGTAFSFAIPSFVGDAWAGGDPPPPDGAGLPDGDSP